MAAGPSPSRRKNVAATADQAAIVFDLKAQGLSYRAIEAVTAAPDGPTGGKRIAASTVCELIRAEAARRIDPRVDEWRAIELERLDATLTRLNNLEQSALEVLKRQHITVNNGRIISLDGEPLPDDGPVLAAIDRLVKIEDARQRNSESRRKLLGLDMPTKVEAQVTEVTQQDLEMQEILAEAKAKVAAEEAALRGEASE